MEQQSSFQTILVVEDDERLLRSLKNGLSEECENLHACVSGEDALDVLQRNAVEILLLDLILPKISGYDVLEYLDESNTEMHVIVMTGLDDEDSHLKALDLGADLVLHKPVTMRVLQAQFRAFARRNSPRMLGQWWLDYGQQAVKGPNDDKITLTSLEFNLLAHLISQDGATATRKEILRDAWRNQVADPRHVYNFVHSLQNKLARTGIKIESVQGIWYRVTIDESW